VLKADKFRYYVGYLVAAHFSSTDRFRWLITKGIVGSFRSLFTFRTCMLDRC